MPDHPTNMHRADAGDAADMPPPGSISEIRLQLISLGMLRTTEAIAWTSIFPYVYFMIKSFNEVPESRIPFYAGSLIAIFTFAEFLSNLAWSRVSDQIGRKKTLLIGSAGALITSLWFGFSRSIASAVASRAFGGLSNPNVGLVQTCAVELTTRDEQRASALSLVIFVRSMGTLVGPVLGGLLADPATNYPSVFPSNSLWTAFPYLLPNLVVAFLQISTFLLTFLYLEETHPQLSLHPPDIGLRLGRAITKFFTGRHQSASSRTSGGLRYDVLNPEQQSRDVDTALEPGSRGSNIELQGIHTRPSLESLDHSDSESLASKDNEHQSMLPESPTSTCTDVPRANKAFTHQVILQILSASLLAFHKMSSDAIMSPFLAAPPDGSPSTTISQEVHNLLSRSIFQTPNGFGYTNQIIGFILLSQAIVAALVQIRLVPSFIDHMGPLKAYRIVLAIYPALYLSTPFLPALPSPLPMVLVVLELWCKAILASIGYICSTMLITKTVPKKDFLARVNGAAASLSCLARSLGPIITGKLVEVGEDMGYVGIAFWALASVAIIGSVESFLLRDHI